MRPAASEWLKLITLPSQVALLVTVPLLIFAAAAARLVTTALNHTPLNGAAPPGPAPGETTPYDPLQFASQLHEGVVWAGALVAILAVLFVSSEYTSGSIRSTVLAVPRRWPTASAKALVLSGVTLILGCAASGGVLMAAGFTAHGGAITLVLSPGLGTQLIVGSGLYLAGISALAIGLTLVIRHLVASLVTVLALITVAPMLLGAVPLGPIRNLVQYLPAIAGQHIFTVDSGPGSLTPWLGISVLGAWSIAALAAGTLALRARDV